MRRCGFAFPEPAETLLLLAWSKSLRAPRNIMWGWRIEDHSAAGYLQEAGCMTRETPPMHIYLFADLMPLTVASCPSLVLNHIHKCCNCYCLLPAQKLPFTFTSYLPPSWPSGMCIIWEAVFVHCLCFLTSNDAKWIKAENKWDYLFSMKL